jgi:hypothetical protein
MRKPEEPHPGFSNIRNVLIAAIAALLLSSSSLIAQRPSDSVAAQKQAMQKLAFIIGRWSGPVTITRGPGQTLHLTQAENVEYKLDGLVLLVQGKSTDTEGKTQFEALATISYDDARHSYRIRAYNDGHYVDTELTVQPDGFSWGFPAGPAKIVNNMHRTSKGEWQENTDVTFGSTPPHHSVEMLLQRQP